jgi:DNA end-binding protein Ku
MFDVPSDKDEYREGLQRIIDAKVAGEEVVAAPVEAPARVVNLMEALKKSLNAVSTSTKKQAKASVATPAKRKRA